MIIKDLYDCENERLIRNIPTSDAKVNRDIIIDEINTSDYDLERAINDFAGNDYKWATVKAYYSVLHAAKALVRLKGVIVKNHKCTYLFLTKLANKGEFEPRYAQGFRIVLDDRMDADYGLKYDEDIALEAIEFAKNFNGYIKKLMRKS